MTKETRRDLILGEISDRVADLLYYNRKEDEELPVGEIEKAIASGEISVDEMAAKFREVIEESLKEDSEEK